MSQIYTYEELANALIKAAELMWELNGNCSEDPQIAKILKMASCLSKPYITPPIMKEQIGTSVINTCAGDKIIVQ